jgi:hypothetical protein
VVFTTPDPEEVAASQARKREKKKAAEREARSGAAQARMAAATAAARQHQAALEAKAIAARGTIGLVRSVSTPSTSGNGNGALSGGPGNSGTAGGGGTAAASNSEDDDNDRPSLPGEKNFQNVRVLQRNLLYVVGLPPSISREDILKKREYFGKFGRIVKVAINRKQIHSDSRASYSAYVTFKRAADAEIAIRSVNGTSLEGRVVRATYGTTKYCSYFLRHVPCNNPGCLYLHELAKVEDCYTKVPLH